MTCQACANPSGGLYITGCQPCAARLAARSPQAHAFAADSSNDRPLRTLCARLLPKLDWPSAKREVAGWWKQDHR